MIAPRCPRFFFFIKTSNFRKPRASARGGENWHEVRSYQSL
jgi:hypothetical protein